MVRLVVYAEDGSVAVECPLAREPLYVGRSPTGSLVLRHPSVSGRHATFWVDDAGVWVEDLGSRNGTFRANGSRLRGPTRLKPGETVRLGYDAWLAIRGEPAGPACDMVLVDDGVAGVPFRGDSFRIGPEPEAHIHVDEPTGLTLTRLGDRIYVASDDGRTEHALPYGAPLRFAERTFRVQQRAGEVAETFDVGDGGHPYRVAVIPPGARPAQARFEDPAAERTHRLGSENRATLIYLLARALHDDQAAGLAGDAVGWRSDDELSAGIWGRAGEGRNLNVLVTRVRAELRAASFNPWCIEKRGGSTRLLVDCVQVEHAGS